MTNNKYVCILALVDETRERTVGILQVHDTLSFRTSLKVHIIITNYTMKFYLLVLRNMITNQFKQKIQTQQ